MLAKGKNMNYKEKILKKFDELLAEGKTIFNSCGWNGKEWQRHPSDIDYRRFKTEALNIIRCACGESSDHYNEMKSVAQDKAMSTNSYYFKDCYGILEAAKKDFEGDYLFNLETEISGEIFADFIVLSKHALSEKNKDVAAVLACAALEDALKRFAKINGEDLSGKDMSEVVNYLKSKGLVAGAQKSLLDVMPKIRNYAMHAEWDKITHEDVSSIIGFVEQFLVQKFSV